MAHHVGGADERDHARVVHGWGHRGRAHRSTAGRTVRVGNAPRGRGARWSTRRGARWSRRRGARSRRERRDGAGAERRDGAGAERRDGLAHEFDDATAPGSDSRLGSPICRWRRDGAGRADLRPRRAPPPAARRAGQDRGAGRSDGPSGSGRCRERRSGPRRCAQTIRDWPRCMSPAVKTPGTLVIQFSSRQTLPRSVRRTPRSCQQARPLRPHEAHGEQDEVAGQGELRSGHLAEGEPAVGAVQLDLHGLKRRARWPAASPRKRRVETA